jgi:hypothetical protein
MMVHLFTPLTSSIYFEGIAPTDFPAIAKRAYSRFQHAMKTYDDKFAKRMARWGRRQRMNQPSTVMSTRIEIRQ